jgi:L-threonylcarbamoyladenylate synthase
MSDLSNSEKSFAIFSCYKKSDIMKCAKLLNSGGVLVFPTDTVYGIGCDPFNSGAVERIYKIKARSKDKPLPILAYSIEDVEKIVSLGKIGRLLAGIYWPGALTIVTRVIDMNLPHNVTAGGDWVGVRIPNNECLLSLLRQCRYLIGTSVNESGHHALISPAEIMSSALHGFDALLEGGPSVSAYESTVIKLSSDGVYIIREGAIRSEEIYRLLNGTEPSENNDDV